MCERTRHNKHYKHTFHHNIAHFVLSITGNHKMKHKTFGISCQETGDPGFISHKAHSNTHMRLCCNHGTVTQSVRWLTFEITKQLSERGICCTVTPGMDLQPDGLFIKKKKDKMLILLLSHAAVRTGKRATEPELRHRPACFTSSFLLCTCSFFMLRRKYKR